MNKNDALKLAKEGILAIGYPNVIGVGIGYKVKDGKKTRTKSVIVFVKHKIAKDKLSSNELVPSIITVEDKDVKTDIIESGEVKALNLPVAPQELTEKVRPLKPGYSVGHKDITAGTIGCFVMRDGKMHILSNNHVLANVNEAEIGDPILQPGAYDGGTIGDTVAYLTDYEKVEMLLSKCKLSNFVCNVFNFFAKLFRRKTRLQPELTGITNLVDCAIAEIIPSIDVDLDVPTIGAPTGLKEAELGMKVRKTGRTTEYTEGEVTTVDLTINVNMGSDIAIFTDQIATTEISAGGDSGSAVFDEETNLVGLLFAGGSGMTVINRIQNVFDALQVTLP